MVRFSGEFILALSSLLATATATTSPSLCYYIASRYDADTIFNKWKTVKVPEGQGYISVTTDYASAEKVARQMQLGGDSYIYYINTLLSENKWINFEEQVTPAHAVSRPTRRTYEKGEWITRTPISADDIVAFEVRKPDFTRVDWSVTGGRLRGQNVCAPQTFFFPHFEGVKCFQIKIA